MCVIGDRVIVTFNLETSNTAHRTSAADFMFQLKSDWTRVQSNAPCGLPLYMAAVTRESHCGLWGHRHLLVGEVSAVGLWGAFETPGPGVLCG